MRRTTTMSLIAGGTVAVVTAGVMARSRVGGRAAANPKPVVGIFPNGMTYVRSGTGPKTLLVIPGGPGNAMPRDFFLPWLLRPYRLLVEDGYTVWMVNRKRNMPKGHTFADMADDYGQLIADEFSGKADMVLGISTGGQIGFYLAARHPDRFGHIVIAVAGYADDEEAKRVLIPYARLAGEGRMGDAMAAMFELLYPSLPRRVTRVLGMVQGRLMFGETHASYPTDVAIEAEAELACDAREVLPDIAVPVLLVCGDSDAGFSKATYEETARLIPDCTLRMYEGRGHMGVLQDRRFAPDVLGFLMHRATEAADRSRVREGATIAAEPTGSSLVGSGAG